MLNPVWLEYKPIGLSTICGTLGSPKLSCSLINTFPFKQSAISLEKRQPATGTMELWEPWAPALEQLLLGLTVTQQAV